MDKLQFDVGLITARLEDFKQEINRRFDIIDKHLETQCSRCMNGVEFRTRLAQHWWHIVSLWAAMASCVGIYFLK